MEGEEEEVEGEEEEVEGKEEEVEGEEEQSASLERRRYGTRHWALLRVGSVGSERPARVRVFKVDISHNW